MKIKGLFLVPATLLGVAAALLVLVLTGNEYEDFVATHGHAHTAPHGGALFAFGNHFGHLELVLDPDSQLLWVYVLDGHAENAVPILDEVVTLTIRPPMGDEERALELRATESPLRGEFVGDSSVFKSVQALPEDWEQFEVQFSDFHFRGMRIEGLEGPFPEGNE